MVGREYLESQAVKALASVPSGAEAEIVATGSEIRLARFSNNEVHQNSVMSNVDFTVRVALGQKVGMVRTNNAESLPDAVRRAVGVAERLPDSRIFAGFAHPAAYAQGAWYCKATEEFAPSGMVDAAMIAASKATAIGAKAYGTVRTSLFSTLVMNNLGVKAYDAGTAAYYKVVGMSDEGGTGIAEQVSPDAGRIDFEAIASRAMDKCARSANPGQIEAGEYEAVLEPNAVATMLSVLSMCGINGMNYHEGKSFASGRMGQQVTNPLVTIVDDGLCADTIKMPFDYEGVPRQRVEIIKNGMVSGMLFDSASAKLAGVRSTGHAMPPGAQFANQAMHLRLKAAEASLDDMIRSVRKGILITRFHYVNPIHQVKTMFTGMTKDGTFLIENGAITRPLKNLRFTDSILGGVLANVELIGKETELFGGDAAVPGGYVVPAVKTARFNFTGTTEH